MSSPVFGNFGIRRIVDQYQRFTRAGLAANFRVKNFQDNPAFSELGFQYVPSITGATVPVGTTDIPITPPPSITLMNMHTLAMAQAAGVQLRAGARYCVVSHTWVVSQMTAQWYITACQQNSDYNAADFETVFRLPNVVGVVTDNLLLQMIDITHDDAFGQPMNWHLVCNASQLSGS